MRMTENQKDSRFFIINFLILVFFLDFKILEIKFVFQNINF
jgi:hypothetical protein